ncbi:ATP-binding cassette domain-containing protein [Streptomyces sp. NPDC015127]|uniref:ATP-binding cassette domain-containing protein n=1 Tax=Streptomyces sp. NPDC015127 TaxID=3364939 RepID=UPI0036F62A31
MLQAVGLTSARRRERVPVVDDLSFEARPGCVTALLGPSGAGKTTALRLMLGLESGRGVTYFRGNPLHRIADPAREVGVLLGDVPGHPARTARSQLRMLSAVVGVPASRADELIDMVGLGGLRDEQLGLLSRGMDRRLGLAAALLGAPQTLILDDPCRELSSRDSGWIFDRLRAHAADGGTVLCTTGDPKEAARIADRVVTIGAGRLFADQDVGDFSRTRLRPRVAVRTPHAARLSDAVSREARAARRSVEVVVEGSSELSVYGSSCAEIGETAYRHGVLVHRLTEEVGDCGPPAPTPALPTVPTAEPPATRPASATATPSAPATPPEPPFGPADVTAPPLAPPSARAEAPACATAPADACPADANAHATTPTDADAEAPSNAQTNAAATANAHAPVPATAHATATANAHAPASATARATAPPATPCPAPGRSRPPRAARSPRWPVRYEVRRLLGVRTAPLVAVVAVAASLVLCVLLARARAGLALPPSVFAAWPDVLPLPPAAFGAGLIGALSFGEEFRYPALAAIRGAVSRRAGLLLAKLVVTAAAALVLATVVVAADVQALRLVYGADLGVDPAKLPSLGVRWAGLCVGCAWAGLLAAGVFRITAAGVAAVLAVPVLIAPLVEQALLGPAARSIAGLPGRIHDMAWLRLPREAERWSAAALHVVAQPVGAALVLSLSALICAYLFTAVRRNASW